MTQKTPSFFIDTINRYGEIERDSNGEQKKGRTFSYGQKIKLSDYKIKESIIFVHIYIDLF